jgi:hypothetical protein
LSHSSPQCRSLVKPFIRNHRQRPTVHGTPCGQSGFTAFPGKSATWAASPASASAPARHPGPAHPENLTHGYCNRCH